MSARLAGVLLVMLLAGGCRRQTAPEEVAPVAPAPAADEVVVAPKAKDAGPETVPLDAPSRYVAPGEEDGAAGAPRATPVDRTVAKALLDSVTNRQECNRVTGCRRERELVALGPEVLPLIVERFKEMRGSNYQRLHLVELAGDAGRGRAVPFLVELLDDTDRNIRAAAAVALGRLRPTALAAQLRQRLAKVAATRDFGFTYGLAFAVERADRRGGRSILLAALSPQSLGNVNPGDLAIAVAAVTDLGLSEACPLLPPFITQPEVFLKKEAIRAARTLLCRQDEVTEAVALDLENAVPSVRREAAQALETLTSTRFATREQWRAWKAARTAR